MSAVLCAGTLLALLGAMATAAAAAPTPAATPTPVPFSDVEVGAMHETLTAGLPAWDAQYVRFTRKYTSRRLYFAEFDDVTRFSKHDVQMTAGAYFPLSAAWSGMLEGSASTHNILASSSIAAGAQYGSGAAWFEGLTVRHTSYNTASVNSAALTLERYWKSFRASYGVTAAHLATTGTDVEHTMEIDDYYGPNVSSIGLGYTTGREVENIGVPALLVSNVNGWSIAGRHWVSGQWAIVYGLETFMQGASYTRSGGHLGLDLRF